LLFDFLDVLFFLELCFEAADLSVLPLRGVLRL
jgi:hypothetical protein